MSHAPVTKDAIRGWQTDCDKSEQNGIPVMHAGKDRVTFARELAAELRKLEPELCKFLVLNSDKYYCRGSTKQFVQKLKYLMRELLQLNRMMRRGRCVTFNKEYWL